MTHYVFAAGTDTDGLLTKNFISRLCRDHFMGDNASRYIHIAEFLLLDDHNHVPVSLLSNHSDYDRDNKNALNSYTNHGIFIIADPTSPTFQEDINTRLNHLNSLCDEFTKPFPVYIVGLKADLYTQKELAEKNAALTLCALGFLNSDLVRKMNIKDVAIISAKTGDGFSDLKDALLNNDNPSTPSIKNKATKSWYHPLNPLSSVLETYTHPHARTLRTSLKQKLKDSFFVFSGKRSAFSDKPHLGLFDILILPALVEPAHSWAVEQRKTMPMMVVPVILLIIIAFPLTAVRFLFAALATVVFSPITIAVHCISSLIAHKSNKRALRLMGESSEGIQSLDDFLKHKELDIENLDVSVRKTPSSYQLMFTEKSSESSGSKDESEQAAPFSVYMDATSPKHAKNLHALFNLNIGAVVTHIEESSDLAEDAKALLLNF